jgi:hypothetical protein
MEEQSDETTPQAAPRAGRATGSRMGIALPVKLKHMKSEGPKHNKMALTAKSAPLKRPAPPRTPPPNKLIVLQKQKQKQLQKEKELQKEIAEKQKDTEIQRLRLELQQQKEIAEKQKDTEMQQLRLELQQQKEATVAAEEEATKQSTASSSQVALTVYSIPRLLEPSFSNFLELSLTFTLTPGAQGYPKGPNFHLNPWGPAHVENAPRRLRAEARFPRS